MSMTQKHKRWCTYGGESINRPQIDINRKTLDIRTWEKRLFPDIFSIITDMLVPSFYHCFETRIIQIFDRYLSHFRTSVSTSSLSAKRLPPRPNRFTRQTLPTVNGKHFCMNILCVEFFCPQKKTHKSTLLFDCTLLKHGRHFDHWNQPLNMRMRVCYLDCHEARLCCYLIIHIEKLLHPLLLFYFHLWPIYWLSLIFNRTITSAIIFLR
jgi:hypothetical protein